MHSRPTTPRLTITPGRRPSASGWKSPRTLESGYDRLDAGDIDSDTYKRQRDRLRSERDEPFKKLRDADEVIDESYLVTAQRVLELAKDAKRLWETRSAVERRDFLARLV